MTNGAIDSDWEENERTARETIEAKLEDVQTEPEAGGVAFDLVTRQPLFIRSKKAETIVEYYEDEDFDLASYKTHPYLPVDVDDAVYECVFIPGTAEGTTSVNKTYDFPRGRLMVVPLEEADADE